MAWYLDQIQDQIDSEEELLERKNFIEKIVDRLTYHVCKKLFKIIRILLLMIHFLISFVDCISGSNYNTFNHKG